MIFLSTNSWVYNDLDMLTFVIYLCTYVKIWYLLFIKYIMLTFSHITFQLSKKTNIHLKKYSVEKYLMLACHSRWFWLKKKSWLSKFMVKSKDIILSISSSLVGYFFFSPRIFIIRVPGWFWSVFSDFIHFILFISLEVSNAIRHHICSNYLITFRF